MSSLEPRRKTSWHLADLQDKSAPFINQVIADLNVTPSDVTQNPRAVTVARYTAAKMIADSWECKNAALYNLVMERTEGKVPDIRVNLGGEELISRLEAARARMISDGAVSDSTLQLETSDAATVNLDAADPIYIDSHADGQQHTSEDQAPADCQSIDIGVNVPRGTVNDLTPDVIEPTEVVSSLTPSVSEPAPAPPGGDLGSIEPGGGSGEPTAVDPEPIPSAAEIKASMPARAPRERMRPGPKPKVRVKTAPGPTRRALERLLAEDEQIANATL